MWKRFFSQQARKPTGLFGRLFAARIFDKGNSDLNSLMLELAAPKSGQDVLEIGFGCGTVLHALADKVGDGSVEGIDFSDAMLHVAAKRNKRHIRSGRVRLTHGNFDEAGYAPASFDTVCSANTIYFWPDVAATCSRIHEAIRPGGRVVFAFVDKSHMDSMPLDMEVFQPISSGEVMDHLAGAGFTAVEDHVIPHKTAQHCVVGYKK